MISDIFYSSERPNWLQYSFFSSILVANLMLKLDIRQKHSSFFRLQFFFLVDAFVPLK